jgi:ABC-type transport system involved in multi-copper enzyme maturation permease subunit
MLMVATLIAVAAGITIAIFTAREPTRIEIDRGKARYERELERCLSGRYGQPEENGYVGTLDEMCADSVRPESFGPQVARFADITEILEGSAFIVLLLGSILGATLAGADHSTGAIAMLLTWEPRRVRVLIARTLAVAIVVVVVTALAQLVMIAGFTAFVSARGTFDQTPPGLASDLVRTVARIASAATLFAIMGVALATIGRSTVAGLGVFLGYLIVAEGFLSNLMFWLQKVTFGRSAIVVVTDRPLELFDTPDIFLLTPGRAWVNLAGWAIGLLALAAAAFRSRDVT